MLFYYFTSMVRTGFQYKAFDVFKNRKQRYTLIQLEMVYNEFDLLKTHHIGIL